MIDPAFSDDEDRVPGAHGPMGYFETGMERHIVDYAWVNG
jgi:hypothetical protein